MADTSDPLRGQLSFGIDLGTTNSGIAVWSEEQGRAVMLPGLDGSPLLPSVVGWDRERQVWVVGCEAEALRRDVPRQVAYSVKRFIGRSFDDPEVCIGRQEMPYTLVRGDSADLRRTVAIDFGGPRLSVPEVSARVLAQLRRHAADALSLPDTAVRHVVITVPAYFNNNQRQATRLAGELAGWEVVDLVDEPTAAALACGDSVLGTEEKLLLVCDLGGGTFDVSLLKASRDEIGYCFRTRAVDGDTRLGGHDIDTAVARWLAAEVERLHGQPLRAPDHALRDRLRRTAEQAKVALSAQEAVEVELLGPDVSGAASVPVRVSLDRRRLEECAGAVRRQMREIVRRAVVDVAGLKWELLGEVILVGGQTLMPAVRRDLQELTGRRPYTVEQPQLAVALGAATYAHILSLGRERFHENTLINVLALALGIRLDDNTFEQLVPANATVPYTSRPFAVTTTEDNQTFIRVEVLQGSRHARGADECVVLGSIEMEVPPAPARKLRFDVQFGVRSDGTLKVEVMDPRRDRREVLDILDGRVLAWREETEAAPLD